MIVYFDMDGTIADLYGVNDWLYHLQSGHTKPYREAHPLIDMRRFGKICQELQKHNIKVGIISWLAKNGNNEYNRKVTLAKKKWLNRHCSAVCFDEIHILPYGTPKYTIPKEEAYLFDDEAWNRSEWENQGYIAYGVDRIIPTLAALLTENS